jgi:RNA-binding protein
MKRLGSVVRATQGIAVVQCDDESYPDPGTSVVDEQLESIGTVVDVFGPVEAPYLAVSPKDVQLVSLVGKPLYARD